MNEEMNVSARISMVDRQITELQQRLDALREVIADMVELGEPTRPQSELYCTLALAIRALTSIRTDLIEQEIERR